MNDIPKALIVALVLALVAGGLWARCSQADGWQPPELGLSTLYTDPPAPECHQSGWIGEISLFTPYAIGRYVRLGPRYVHNSCLDEENDRAHSDAIGMHVTIILGE